MLTTMPGFTRPDAMGIEPVPDLQQWDRAMEAHDAGRLRDAVLAVLRYINSDLLKGVKPMKNFEVQRSHGSATISIALDHDCLRVSAPFLSVADAQRVPLLRKVAEVNFEPLNLTQIALNNEELWFCFTADLSVCHPFKVYDAINEICRFADDFDDEFIEKYGATALSEPKTKPLSDKQQQAAWKNLQIMGEEYDRYIADFEQNRMLRSMWDLIAAHLFRLGSLPYVHGTLRTKLEDALGVHYNNQLDGQYRLDKGKAFLNTLYHETTQEDFLKSVYQADKLVSTKRRSNPDIIASLLDEHQEQVRRPLNDGSAFDAAWAMYVIFVRMLYDFNLAAGYQYELYTALEKGAGKDSGVATKHYLACFEKMLRKQVPARRSASGGLLSKLFG